MLQLPPLCFSPLRLFTKTFYQAGWPDEYLLSVEWNIANNGNTCKWCPKGQGKCGSTHHESPIDLRREIGIEGDKNANECIDIHWMKYEDSSCTWEQLVDKKAFSIERHALKVTQPLEITPEVTRLDCPADGGRKFGRIDFSKGFSAWWFLSHIDFKVPSEHTQDGKRYSAEVQMAHFYSLGASEAGVENQVRNVVGYFSIRGLSIIVLANNLFVCLTSPDGSCVYLFGSLRRRSTISTT
jgi:hypothetical protein